MWLSSSRRMRSTLLLSTVTSSMMFASQGCNVLVAPGGFTASEFDLDPECPATGDVVGADTFLAATTAVHDAARSLQSDARDELEALAQGLGLETSSSSTLSELATRVEAAMLGSLGGKAPNLEIVHEAVFCVLDTDVASTAAAGCDPAAEPLVDCLGTCVGAAGATLECDGDAVLHCEVDAPQGTCDTECLGTCASEILDDVCVGACIGTCDGICTAVEPDGSCSGACLGLCEGMCGLVSPGGACEGTCLGDCVIASTIPDCEDTAVPMCVPGPTGVVECSERCRGLVSVPGLVDACTASVAALANAATECVPPSSQAHATFAIDVDESEAAALQVWADDVAARMSNLLAAQALASSLLDSALSPETGLLPVVDGLASAAASTAEDAPCVAEQLDAAAAVLRELPAELEDVVRAVSILDMARSGG